jgi:hypothetical protein
MLCILISLGYFILRNAISFCVEQINKKNKRREVSQLPPPNQLHINQTPTVPP